MTISLLGANMRVILVPGASLRCALFANQCTPIFVFNFTVSDLPWGQWQDSLSFCICELLFSITRVL